MNRPTDEQIEIAIMFLESAEDETGEACKPVAAWLEHELREHMLRSEARRGGVTITALRRKLAGA